MRPESFKNKVEALASPAMAPLQDSSLADRLLYALRRRGWKPVDLDRFMAEDLRKPYHPGWTHDVLTGQTKAPRSDRLMSAAKGLRVADLWLSRNEGPIERPEDRVETCADVPRWAEASADPTVAMVYPSWVVRAVASSPVMVRPTAWTPALVVQACSFLLACAPEEQRVAAARAEEEHRRSDEDGGK
jgi:hypothetical protein